SRRGLALPAGRGRRPAPYRGPGPLDLANRHRRSTGHSDPGPGGRRPIPGLRVVAKLHTVRRGAAPQGGSRADSQAGEDMLAARLHGNHDLRVEQMPEPEEVPSGQVRVRPEWCGICGTDLHEYAHGPLYTPTENLPQV